jgi:hypothetical protein
VDVEEDDGDDDDLSLLLVLNDGVRPLSKPVSVLDRGSFPEAALLGGGARGSETETRFCDKFVVRATERVLGTTFGGACDCGVEWVGGGATTVGTASDVADPCR